MRRIHNKLLALTMTAVMAFGMIPAQELCAAEETQKRTQAAPAEQADPDGELVYERIEISTPEEFADFASKCYIDSWSRDKYVSLKADIDLTGAKIAIVPVFNGIFDGVGHTISGFDYLGDGYVVGLFRYVERDGVIQNLTLKGNIEAENQKECIGSISGVNYGTIRNCTFQGTVSGRDTVGGIVGVNGATGVISGSAAKGRITGYYSTGGIAGINHGTLNYCTNRAGINDNSAWVEEDDEMGTGMGILESLASNDDNELYSGVDTGGIAGFSDGTITRCTNSGTVGYEHTGYNIGGIAGRQSGVVSLCTNNGTVYGRKDIGGIVGQMEPFIEISEAESLRNAVDKLHELIDKTISDMQASKDGVKRDFDTLTQYSDNAVDAADVLAEQIGDFVDDNLDQAQAITDRLDHVMEMTPDVFNDFEAAENSFTNAVQALRNISEDLGKITDIGDEPYDASANKRITLLHTVGGYVVSDAYNPGVGEEVTVTAKLDDVTAYRVSEIKVIKVTNGEEIAKETSASCSFTMPAENVRVEVYFEPVLGIAIQSDAVTKDVSDEESTASEEETELDTEEESETISEEISDTTESEEEETESSGASSEPELSETPETSGSDTSEDNEETEIPEMPAESETSESTETPEDAAGFGSDVPVLYGEASSEESSIDETKDNHLEDNENDHDGEEDADNVSRPVRQPGPTTKAGDAVVRIRSNLSGNAGCAAGEGSDGKKRALVTVEPSGGYTVEYVTLDGSRITADSGNSYSFPVEGGKEYEVYINFKKTATKSGAVKNAKTEIKYAIREAQDAANKIRDEADNNKIDVAELQKMLSAMTTVMENTEILVEIYGDQAADVLRTVNENLGNSSDHLKSALDSVKAATRHTRDIVDYVNEQPAISFTKLGAEYDYNRINLNNQLHGISDSLKMLSDNASDYSDVVNADLRAVNDQINIIFNLLADRLSDVQKLSLAVLYEEVDADDIDSITTGRAEACTNKGVIKGDINVGGIAGSMSIDDEDPEDSAAGAIEYELGRRFITKCLVTGSVNEGHVTSKKNGAGGVCGYMNHGIIVDSECYGSVESTEGDYVGGICGESLTIIKRCYALCAVTGNRNVGGIAGYADTLTDCYSMADVQSENGRAGAIAGQVSGYDTVDAGADDGSEEEGGPKVSCNYYVDEGIHGIDNISYIGVAEPISYQELLTVEQLPTAFGHLKVIYMIEDTYLGSEEVKYGAKLDHLSFPQIPGKEGYYGVWPDVSDRTMTGTMVVRAEYKGNVTVVRSDGDADAVDEGQWNRPYALIEDVFTEDTVLNARVSDMAPPEEAAGKQNVVYEVTLENSGLKETDSFRLRILNPYENAVAYAYQNDEWIVVESRSRGQYLQVVMTGTQGYFCVAEDTLNLTFVIGCVVAVMVVVLLAVMIRKRARRRKQQLQKQAEKTDMK